MSDLFSYAVAFIVTLMSIKLLRPLAVRLGLVDLPSDRKKHEGSIPLIGGVAMLLGFLFALLILPTSLIHYRGFIAGCVLLVLVGLLDDFHELSARSRLVAQIIAGLFMTAWSGVILTDLGNLFLIGNVVVNNWGIPISVVAVVGIINSVNMTDGVDGLAGTLALIEMFFLAVLARQAHQATAFHILVLMMSSTLAFLCFNLRQGNREKFLVFMGDAGSMLLGFVLVWFLVALSQKTAYAATPVTMLWIMALPLFDTISVMLYRLEKKKSLFSPDREHLHHLLEAFNFPPLRIVMTLGSLAFFFGLIGTLAFYKHVSEGLMFIGFIALFMLYYAGLVFLKKKALRTRS